MSIIDLSTRLTSEWESFTSNLTSSESLVYISSGYNLDDGPSSVDLMVGKNCILQSEAKEFSIPEDGIRISAFQSILIETAQDVGVPYNVFGLVTGKGKLILKGTFISTGKIDPGFKGKLIIGLYNGSNETVVLKTGEPLCTCLFFQTEATIKHPLKSSGRYKGESQDLLSRGQKIRFWWKREKDIIVFIVAVIAMIGTFGRFIIDAFK